MSLSSSLSNGVENIKLITSLTTSDTEKNIKEQIISSVKESKDLIHRVKDKRLRKKFEKEYDDLKDGILESIKNNNKITKLELLNLKLEFNDIITLAEDNNIKEKESLVTIIGGYINGTNTEDIIEKTRDIFDRDVESFTPEESKVLLKYTNVRYKKLLNRSISIGSSSLNDIEGRREVNEFQEKLISKYLGNKKYNNEYIFGYNNEVGNFLIKITDFESKLKKDNFNDLNNKELENYMSYLSSIGKLDFKSIEERLGEKKTKHIFKFLKRKKKSFLDMLEGKISNLYNKISNDFNKMFFNENIKVKNVKKEVNKVDFNLNIGKKILKKDKKLRKAVLEKDKKTRNNCPNKGNNNYDDLILFAKEEEGKEKIERIEKDFKKTILKRFNNDEKLTDKLIKSLNNDLILGPCGFDLINALEKFGKENTEEFKKKKINKLSIDDIKILGKAVNNRNQLVFKAAMGVAIATGNVAKVKTLTKSIENTTNQKNVINILSNKDLNNIILQKENGKTNSEIMSQLRKEDKAFDEAMKKYEIESKKREAEREKQKLEEEQKLKEEAEKNAQEELENKLNSETKYLTTYKGKYIEYFENDGEVILDNNTTEGLIISNLELEEIKKVPEKANNLIDFHKKLTDLKLGFIWNFRDELDRFIGDDISIDYMDGNGISDGELLKILNSVIVLLGHDKVSNTDSATKTINIENKKLESKKILGKEPIESYLWLKGYMGSWGIKEFKLEEDLEKLNV